MFFRPLFLVFMVAQMLMGCQEDLSRPYVQDPSELLSATQHERLQSFQQLLHIEQDVEFLLVILDQATIDLDQRALELFEQNKLGSNTAGARGLLLLIDPFSEQARIEVGYDLEGIFPDGFVASLEYEQMLPFFQQDRVGHGVEALTELLVARLLRQGEGDSQPAGAIDHLSGGAGSRISTSGSVAPITSVKLEKYLPQATPLATLDEYRQSLRDLIKDPQLRIYTQESRQFFSNWLVTDAQQKNALKVLEQVFSKAEVRILDRLAVIRFPVANRQASPYFMQQSVDGWQLDFVEMSRVIGFNHRNQWHFRQQQHPYMFAFSDWQLDQHGFPHAP